MTDDERRTWVTAGREPAPLAPHPWDEYGQPAPLDPVGPDGELETWRCEVDDHPAHRPDECAAAIDEELDELGPRIRSAQSRLEEAEAELEDLIDRELELKEARKRTER